MKRILLIGIGACAAVIVGVTNVPAQTGQTEQSVPAQSIDEAVKTLEAVGADAAKLKQFCHLNKLFDNVREKEDAALEKQIEDAFEALGADFAAAWDVGDNADENTPEGKKFFDALSALTGKCG
jgi:L-alanine-DL-glutamate epimerase-like enolase superfamily enzyme